MNSTLRNSAKSTSSDVMVDLTAIKTLPFRLDGRSYVCIEYITGKGTSCFNQVSVNTFIWDAKERLSEYNLVSWLSKPLAF